MSQDRFEYEVQRAMNDPIYRIYINVRDIENATANLQDLGVAEQIINEIGYATTRLRAEMEAMQGRLNESATRPQVSNAETFR